MLTMKYQIKKEFAEKKGIPEEIEAVIDAETSRAICLYNSKIHCWIPKSCIIKTEKSGNKIEPPKLKNRTAKMVQYKNSNKKAIKIDFPFNKDDVEHVKTLPGRRFHNEGVQKYWTCPLSLDAVESLKYWGFELDAQLEEYIQKSKTNISEVKADIEIPGLQMDLFPYQKKGVAFIEEKEGRALIADEMGLGKTAQALAWLQLHPEKRPAIIIVPASLKLNWKKEAEMWMDNPNIQILSGKKPTDYPIIGDIIIINYDILTSWLPELQKINAQVLITDECHYYKNTKAQRTKAVMKLAKNIPHIIALSGTPIVNRPIEGFNAIKLIDDTIAPNFWSFAHKYCDAKHNGFGWDFSGASNSDELHEKLTNSIMIRRKKSEVLKDLPAKIRSIIPIELSNRKEYDKAEADFISYIRRTKGKKAAEKAGNAEILARIEGLKQLAVKGKLKQSLDWIKDHLDINGKLVIFATHKNVIDSLMKELQDYNPVKVDGSVSGQGRQDAVDIFQNDNTCRVFIGNIKAAGVGLTLTAASSVAFLELGWSPGDHDQAEDRIHRIGQEADSVNIYYLLAAESIEEEIAALIDKKRKVLDEILDGKETEESSLLSELLTKYEEE